VIPDAAADALLALTLLILAARLLFDRDLFTSAVLFVAFGMAMALVWVRLSAPDVALAEAAVGAGLTGALVLKAVGQMPSGRRLVPLRAPVVAAVVVLAGALSALLLAVLAPLLREGTGLAREATAGAAALGLEQPVTAVLLVFRGFDTWLELAVLLVTLLAVLGAGQTTRLTLRRVSAEPDRQLPTFARLLLPVAVVVAGYLTWQGTKSPGGAFQGGAVLASALVLGHLAGVRVFSILRGFWLRLTAILAFALPLTLTLPALLSGRPLLSYPTANTGMVVLGVEVAIAVSVAFVLAALFVASEPPPAEDRESPPAEGGE
jgi:multisubunit Na+/H+ antiporter MnhB subunit